MEWNGEWSTCGWTLPHTACRLNSPPPPPLVPTADVDREISAQKIAINARARLVAGAWLDAMARDAR